MEQKLKSLEKPIEVKAYNPTKEEIILQTFIQKRKDEMQAYRTSLGIEKDWREADIEYIPHELDFGTPRKRFEADQDTGLRSRLVPIGDNTQNWRSSASSPTLLVKIQTAFSILIDQDPEGMLTAISKMYESRTKIAYSIWKRNWAITDAKQVLRLFIFDMLKYGWGVGRSFPKKIAYDKSVLVEYDSKDPGKNKYETKQLTWFNDVGRSRLSPYKTWIDEQTKPYDVYSMNDCYYEMDFSYDEAKLEFGGYPNFDFVKPDSRVTDNSIKPASTNDEKQLSERTDIVTIGFYENRLKDLYGVWAPKDKIVLHKCPLPNDDGYLSLWHSPWILRSADSPYGISIWTIIKQDKELYDKFDNMTIDQLVLSIMKFGYHTGTSGVLGDGVMQIIPGQSKQITNGKFDWMEIPGPGEEAWKGLSFRQDKMDNNSGITPTLQGETNSGTLGQSQLDREASFKRLKVPLDNIAWAIEQDAYLTLSWSKQIFSTPEIKEFTTEDEMMAYEEEIGIKHNELFAQTTPNAETGMQEQTGLTASYLPELALHLEDRDGQLFESAQSRYFQVGKDLPVDQLNWKGIFKVIPRSIIDKSETIMKQVKTEMANMLIPLLSQPPELVMKACIQLCKVNEEEPKDWLPDIWFNPPQPEPVQPEPPRVSVSIKADAGTSYGQELLKQTGVQDNELPAPDQLPKTSEQNPGAKAGHTMQGNTGNTRRGAPSVVPKEQVSAPTQKSTMGGLFVKKS